MGFRVFLVHPTVVSVLLSPLVQRCIVSRMRDFYLSEPSLFHAPPPGTLPASPLYNPASEILLLPLPDTALGSFWIRRSILLILITFFDISILILGQGPGPEDGPDSPQVCGSYHQGGQVKSRLYRYCLYCADYIYNSTLYIALLRVHLTVQCKEYIIHVTT